MYSLSFKKLVAVQVACSVFFFSVCVFACLFFTGARLSALLTDQQSFARQVISVPSEEKLQVGGNKVRTLSQFFICNGRVNKCILEVSRTTCANHLRMVNVRAALAPVF